MLQVYLLDGLVGDLVMVSIWLRRAMLAEGVAVPLGLWGLVDVLDLMILYQYAGAVSLVEIKLCLLYVICCHLVMSSAFLRCSVYLLRIFRCRCPCSTMKLINSITIYLKF